MRYLLKSIYEKVSTKQVMFFFVFFLLFTSFVLPFVADLTTRVIGVAESPDTTFAFDLEYLYELVESYGKSGRQFYVLMRWTFDIVWPLTYGAFLVSATAYFARRSNCKFSYRLLYIPFLAVLFDLLENTHATVIMLLFPTRIELFGYFLMLSSLLKWSMLGMSFLVVLGLFVRFLIQKDKSL